MRPLSLSHSSFFSPSLWAEESQHDLNIADCDFKPKLNQSKSCQTLYVNKSLTSVAIFERIVVFPDPEGP